MMKSVYLYKIFTFEKENAHSFPSLSQIIRIFASFFDQPMRWASFFCDQNHLTTEYETITSW